MAIEIHVGIGGAAGDGVASAGNTVAQTAARQGLCAFAYNAHQSLIRGGHSWLRLRISEEQPWNQGDHVDALIALNQDSMNRHFPELPKGGLVIYNADKVKPEGEGKAQLCGLPVGQLAGPGALPVMQNTAAVGALCYLVGLRIENLESVFQSVFAKKPQVVEANVKVARAGYEYASKNFQKHRVQLPVKKRKLAWMAGNDVIAYAAANAGCKFYCAYPMSPASGILHWMAAHSQSLGICVRQMEDEIAVINTTIGAAHMGVRAMCATSGGGFALMTEAIGMAAMLETPVVAVNVMRAGPSTGVPTKTEQADLNQVFGASQGDYERFILAPLDITDFLKQIPLAFNLAEKYQCPVLVLSDLWLSEGNMTIEPKDLDEEPPIDRGELILSANGKEQKDYYRYKDTPSGVSPRAVPGLPGHLYTAATDEHDEDGVLITDMYTDPVIRKKMVEKRARKLSKALNDLPNPEFEGPKDAEVTLVGWGSTWGVIREAAELLTQKGTKTNVLGIRYLVPFQSEAVAKILSASKKFIIVENNFSGQFARHLRAETGLVAHGHVRKYDGEPFDPKHVVAGVEAVLKGEKVYRALSEEPGWRTPHPPGPSVHSAVGAQSTH